jgi:alginate O-acetyltransferase complex protein AlgJ
MQLHKSEHAKFSTAVGKDGWLYMWDIDDIHKKLLGEIRLTDAELSNAIRNIEARQLWCASRGVTYLHMIAPDKATIYPQFLPDGVSVPDDNLLAQYRKALSDYGDRINSLDVIDRLRQEAQSSQVYFKTDAHWNYEGAMIVVNLIVEALARSGIAIPPIVKSEIKSRNVKRILELGALMPDPEFEYFNVIEPVERFAPETYVSQTSRGKAQVFTHKDASLPKCIIFRDSFTSFFLPFLTNRFSKTIVLNSRVFWHDLVEEFKPDVVIVEIAERFLHPIAIDLQNKGFKSFFGIETSELTQSA